MYPFSPGRYSQELLSAANPYLVMCALTHHFQNSLHVVNCLTIFLTALMTANWIVQKFLFKVLATCLTFSA